MLFYLFIVNASPSLPFVELSVTTGVDTVELPAQNDGISDGINMPGVAFANTTQRLIYVSSPLYLLRIVTLALSL